MHGTKGTPRGPPKGTPREAPRGNPKREPQGEAQEEPQGEQSVDQVRYMMSVMSDHLIENIKFSVCHLYVKSLLGALLTFLI